MMDPYTKEPEWVKCYVAVQYLVIGIGLLVTVAVLLALAVVGRAGL